MRRMAPSGDIAQKDADLAVLHVSRRSAILGANARRVVARFGEAGLVDGENGLAVCPAVPARRPAAHRAPEPHPRRQRRAAVACHRACFSGLFRQLPAILAFHLTQDALQKRQGPPTRFFAREVRGNAAMEGGEGTCPLHDVLERGPGSGWGSLVRRLHGVLLSSAGAEGLFFLPSASHREKSHWGLVVDVGLSLSPPPASHSCRMIGLKPARETFCPGDQPLAFSALFWYTGSSDFFSCSWAPASLTWWTFPDRMDAAIFSLGACI